MRFQFDHIVHFTQDPHTAAEKLNALKLHAVPGGRHESLGTFNALSYFGLSYIELLGVFDPSPADLSGPGDRYSLKESIKNNGGTERLIRCALRSEDLAAEAERLRGLGFDVYGPSPLSRRRPDGSTVSWKLLFAGRAEDSLPLPFFIEWDQKDDDRYEDLRSRKITEAHPEGCPALSAIGFAVKDAEQSARSWASALGLEMTEAFAEPELNAVGRRLKLAGGNLDFYTPKGPGLAAGALAAGGEGPFLIDIAGTGKSGIHKVCGALYRLR